MPDDAEPIGLVGRAAVPLTYDGLIADPSVVRSIVAQSYAASSLRSCIESCAGPDAHFLVATRASDLVGFLHYDSAGPEPELHRIYVDPALKREGIGTALLGELHARLGPGATYVLMVVAANRAAVSFYERHGLVVEERLDGVEYMHERMGVEFPLGTSVVPALIMRYTKQKEACHGSVHG